MSFTTELANKQFQLNLVIQIGSEYYSQYQPDSGLTVDSNKVGTVNKVKLNPLNVDIRDVKTTINTASFDLLDKDEIISAGIGANVNQFLNEDVTIYVGFITGSFDFADYKLLSQVTVKKIAKKSNAYTFTCAEVTSLLQGDIFDTFDTLDGSITDVQTTLDLNDASNFPSSGKVRVGDEYIAYSGKTLNQLTGLGRGDESSTAASHDDGEQVFLITDTGSINPLTLLLQMMISPGGGGTYDVLSDGLGIDESLIDVSGIETIRDDNFSSDLFDFLLDNVGNAQRFFEDEILQATNTRFIPKDGAISLALLDQVDLTATVPEIDENSTTRLPSWTIGSDKITNRITMKYNYSWGEKKFSRIETFDDSESISTYGIKNPLTYEFRGITAALSGSAIVANRANRLLERLSTPKAEIGTDTHFDQVERNIGDKINLTHRYLPQQGGSLGFSDQLEVLSKAVDFNNASVKFKLQFTSYNGLRLGLIAPSPNIVSVTSQSVFEVPDGTCYEVGYAIRLWDDNTNDYTSDPVNTITNISGNFLTVDAAFSTTLTTDIKIKFADYDDASGTQRSRYAWIGSNTGFFDDESKSYEIWF